MPSTAPTPPMQVWQPQNRKGEMASNEVALTDDRSTASSGKPLSEVERLTATRDKLEIADNRLTASRGGHHSKVGRVDCHT